MDKTIIRFPWFGVVASLTVIMLLILTSSEYASTLWGEGFINLMSDFSVRLVLAVTVLIAFIVDFFRCKNSGSELDEKIKSLNAQVDELFRSKYALQNKAHQYSGHADKLKMFISDKLLEYIEYDEKFLHFKNIASEVRHNGVICYDQVTSLLRQLMEGELSDDLRGQCQQSMSSMIYLWDLLDLSTTDNIAMYIANKIYEAEEVQYRQMLDNEAEVAYTPSFPTMKAVTRTLAGFVEDREAFEKIAAVNEPELRYEDKQFRIVLSSAGHFLGNENYIVLMLENLINNGLYYSGQKKYKNQYAKLAVGLNLVQGNAVIKVYNPGPQIPDDVRDKIYQLGFSTKRTKGHNGKGLGLYFVKQIVSGYEGIIGFRNINNQEEKFVVRIECENGEIVNEIIETVVNMNGKLSCKNDEESIVKTYRIKIKDRIRNIEISAQASKAINRFDEFDESGETRIVDPQHAERPAWCIDVKESVSTTEVVFRPLDTVGVEFTIKIPTLEYRMDEDYHKPEEDEESEYLSGNYVDEDEYIED